jgi:peroxiredoxin
LMAYVGEDAKQKTLQKVHAFLSSRSKLSIQDVQTGMLAAAMLEFQADKKPARDTYQLLSDLLEDDEREEMQSLRLNLQASIRRLELLGKKFEILAKSLGGSEIKIDDYAGKYVVVDFFASWCEPCLADVTRLKKYYDKHHARGLEVIGISLDVDGESLTQFLDRTQLPWPIVHDNAENPLDRLQMKFGVLQLPTVFLLNKEGQVISLEAHGAELERWIERLFESPTPAPPVPQP